MEYRSYQHIVRFGEDECDGIDTGTVYVFPKIDGTNAVVWLGDNGEIHAGSRRRELSLDNDNAGFYAWVLEQDNLKEYVNAHPNHYVYGEWLVPHTLRNYRDGAWRHFYVFDVVEQREDGACVHLHYDDYTPLLIEYNIEYIPPLRILHNPTYEYLIHCLDENTYLIDDGNGVGEGIVLKNYQYSNQYGRTTWGKIVRNEFKEKHYSIMGAPEKEFKLIEEQFVDKYCTAEFIKKEYAKIINENGGRGWNSKLIPRLLNTVFHTLIDEECFHFVSKNKLPTIDFKRLYNLTIYKIKATMPELF